MQNLSQLFAHYLRLFWSLTQPSKNRNVSCDYNGGKAAENVVDMVTINPLYNVFVYHLACIS